MVFDILAESIYWHDWYIQGLRWYCVLCGFATPSVLMTHIRMIHASEAGFHIQCNLQGCMRTFRNFHTYRNHVYSMHDIHAVAEQNREETQPSDVESKDSDSEHEYPESLPGISAEKLIIPEVCGWAVAISSTCRWQCNIHIYWNLVSTCNMYTLK